ncbi:MAG: hypothetical protein AB8C46_02585, partial [Burkholderiaceae bacterium]
GASGGGDIGAGGALGRFRSVKVTMQRLNDQSAQAVVGKTDERGFATLKVCYLNSPYKVSFSKSDDPADTSDYFDEAVENFRPLRDGDVFSVVVPNMQRSFVGITSFTTAAARNVERQLASAPSGASGFAVKNDATIVKDANDAVSAILTDQLPGNFRASSGSGLFEITAAPIALDNASLDQAGRIPDNDRGRYSAANAGFAVQAGTFLPNEERPALVAAQQLAEDLSDGKLDLINSNGCSIASKIGSQTGGNQDGNGCANDGDRYLAYTYDAFWRAKSVATSSIASRAGDQSLSGREAALAEYETEIQKIIQVDPCPAGQIPCGESFVTRSDITQRVRMNTRGEIEIERVGGVNFDVSADGTSIGFIDGKRDLTLVATGVGDRNDGFVDLRVGTEGQIVALHKSRQTITYVAPLTPHQVTGREPSRDAARADLLGTLSRLEPKQISIGEPIVAISIPPASRVGTTPQTSAIFYLVLGNGKLVAVSDQNNPVATAQVLPWPVVDMAFDKFVPPALVPEYGAARDRGQYPFQGPRRQYFLTRLGKIRVILEGGNAPGFELNVPGTVVQLASESRANVYALNSDGEVYWINADQAAGRPLHTVVKVALTKRACWIARREAVTCGDGEVFRWSEQLKPLEFRNANAQPGSQRDLIYISEGIGQPERVTLNGQRIWRLNSVEEFYLSSETQGAFLSEGMRYLPVDGDPFDPRDLAAGTRNLNTTRCEFTYENGRVEDRPYLHGWQIKRGLKAALSGLAQSPLVIENNGRRILNQTTSRPQIDSEATIQAILSASLERQLSLQAPGQSEHQDGCRQATGDAGTWQFPATPNRAADLAEIRARGFETTDFLHRSSVAFRRDQGSPVERGDIPEYQVGATFGELGNEFFVNVNSTAVAGRVRTPSKGLLLWDSSKLYPLDRTLQQWQYDYSQQLNGQPDDLDVFGPGGRQPCTPGSARCMVVSLLARQYFNDASRFRLCFDLSFNTPAPDSTTTFRPVCTLHEFDGELVGAEMFNKWFYPPRLPKTPENYLDFGFFLNAPSE